MMLFRQRNNKVFFLFLRILLATCFFLQANPSFAEERTLKFWQFWPEKWIRPELNRFEKEHNVKIIVERLTWADGLNKIITSLAADQAPDVIEIGSTWVAGFTKGGGLQVIEPNNLIETLNGWEPSKYKDRYYAIPWTLSTGALFYNKDLLQQAGFTYFPRDWTELLETSKGISLLGENIFGYGMKTGSYSTWQKFLPFAWSNGARLLYDDATKTGVASPEFLEAVEFYQQLKVFSLYDDNIAIRKAFQENKIGFMVDEPGQIERLRKESPEINFGVHALPKAVSTRQSIAFAGGQMLAITKNATQHDLAEKLIHFLVQPEVTKSITSKITTLFPSHKSAINDSFYTQEHPELQVFLEILNHSTSPPAHPNWIGIQEVFSEQLERVLYGLKTPQEGMNQAQQEIEQILKDATKTELDDSEGLIKTTQWLRSILIVIALIIVVFLSLLLRKGIKSWKKNPRLMKKRTLYQTNTFLFLSPWLFVFCTFSLFPIAYSFFLSFTRFHASGTATPSWVGLANYSKLLQDQHFIDSVWTSLKFVMGTVPPIIIIAILLAVVLNRIKRFRTFYRVSFFMPVVTSVLVIATLFMELYAPTGIINEILSWFGIKGKHWLKDPSWALPSIMWMNIWASFGFYTLMLLAGLQNIPNEYYEASSLEGATPVRQFFTITLPLLRPTILVATLMDTILAFQVFGEIFIMTKGGPLRTTESSVYFLYNAAFHKQEMGYASAAAYYIFLVLLIFIGTQFLLVRQKKVKTKLKNS